MLFAKVKFLEPLSKPCNPVTAMAESSMYHCVCRTLQEASRWPSIALVERATFKEQPLLRGWESDCTLNISRRSACREIIINSRGLDPTLLLSSNIGCDSKRLHQKAQHMGGRKKRHGRTTIHVHLVCRISKSHSYHPHSLQVILIMQDFGGRR